MKKRILGISGKKQSGKDTIAGFLKEIVSPALVVRIGFADALKEEVAAACGVPVEFVESYKSNFRKILQGWGTDFRRELCGETYWIDKTREKIQKLPDGVLVVVPDVRFPNEAEMVDELGGKLWRVERGTSGADEHPSETAMDNFVQFDSILKNDSSLGALKAAAGMAYAYSFAA